MYPKSISQEEYKEQEEKKEKALEKRLRQLEKETQSNPIVKAALNEKGEMEEYHEKDKKWGVVSKLMSVAREEFFDNDKDFKKTVNALGEALKELNS